MKRTKYAWAFRLILLKSPRPFSWYSIYYCEGPELQKDTPAIDRFGKFLWCTSPRKLKTLHEHLRMDIMSLGSASHVTSTIDIPEALSGFNLDTRDSKKWNESVGLLNLLVDYLENLPQKDTYTEGLCAFLGRLSDHMFMEESMHGFDKIDRCGRERILSSVGEAILKVYDNSIVL